MAARVVRGSAAESRFEALHGRDLTPLVGRDEELAMLERRWQQAKAGEGRVVVLIGEPGIGKSRLAQAMLEQPAGEPHMRLRYFCSPHHQASALRPYITRRCRGMPPRLPNSENTSENQTGLIGRFGRDGRSYRSGRRRTDGSGAPPVLSLGC